MAPCQLQVRAASACGRPHAMGGSAGKTSADSVPRQKTTKHQFQHPLPSTTTDISATAGIDGRWWYSGWRWEAVRAIRRRD